MMMIHTVNFYYDPHAAKEILMKVSELATTVTGVAAQLTKVQNEVLTRLNDLENALIDVEIPEEAVTAINGLRTQAQALDDIVPDVVVEPTPEPVVDPVVEPVVE